MKDSFTTETQSTEKNVSQASMRVVYSVKNDKRRADKVPGAISPGEQRMQTCRGVITKRYMASMNDWPEITIRDDSGEETSWGRHGHSAADDRHYQVGRRIEVDYILERRTEAADPRPEHKVVLEVRIEVPPETIRERIIRHRTTGNW